MIITLYVFIALSLMRFFANVPFMSFRYETTEKDGLAPNGGYIRVYGVVYFFRMSIIRWEVNS